MDIKKALLITRDRIECLSSFIPSNESEKKTALETMEYLQFIERLLSEMEEN